MFRHSSLVRDVWGFSDGCGDLAGGIRVDVMFPRIGDACAIELVHIAESITGIGRILL